MITEFELQTGEGNTVEIVGREADQLWLIIDEATLVKMIRLAFDLPEFTLAELIDMVRFHTPPGIGFRIPPGGASKGHRRGK